MSLLNKAAVKRRFLEIAHAKGRTNFTMVSSDALVDAEAALKKFMHDYVHTHRNCKTIGKK